MGIAEKMEDYFTAMLESRMKEEASLACHAIHAEAISHMRPTTAARSLAIPEEELCRAYLQAQMDWMKELGRHLMTRRSPRA
jgi:hypothetical protein